MPVKEVDGEPSEGMSEGEEIEPKNLRSGRPTMGVERHPKTGHPLDPEPGLGGIFKFRLLVLESKAFFR
jgi:hypothetical protein